MLSATDTIMTSAARHPNTAARIFPLPDPQKAAQPDLFFGPA